MNYLKSFFTTVKDYNLIFFAIIILLFQLIAIALLPYSIHIYNPASIMTLYCFINLEASISQLITAALISTGVSYILYEILSRMSKKIHVLLFNLLDIFFVLGLMSIFNCIFMPALAHTLMSIVNVKQDTFSYLVAYIVAAFVIILLCMGVYFIIKNVDKNILSTVSNLSQFEKNIKL